MRLLIQGVSGSAPVLKIDRFTYVGRSLSSWLGSILQDHTINNLSAKDASPSEKLSIGTVEFFVDHNALTPVALHRILPNSEVAELSLVMRVSEYDFRATDNLKG